MGVSVINSYLGSSIPLPSILMDELRLVLLASILRSKNFRFVKNLKIRHNVYRTNALLTTLANELIPK